MRTLRFHAYGEPADVLRLEAAAIPAPDPGSVRVRVQACGLNPADWALCRGLFPRDLPRGIGLDVSGVVDAVGDGVVGVGVGDAVLGPANYVDHASAGASDYAILDHWTPVPPGLGMPEAASLPMAVETAGAMIGFAAVQMALLRGARVIAVSGETFAERLRALGATVTAYGDGLVERVRAIPGAPPDLIFDAAPVNMTAASSALPDLVAIADGDPRRVITCGDFAGAAALGVRTGFEEQASGPGGALLRYDMLGEFARLAAEGRFAVPIARTFALEQWREALAISLSGRARGKLVLLPAVAASPHSEMPEIGAEPLGRRYQF